MPLGSKEFHPKELFLEKRQDLLWKDTMMLHSYSINAILIMILLLIGLYMIQ